MRRHKLFLGLSPTFRSADITVTQECPDLSDFFGTLDAGEKERTNELAKVL